MQNKRSDVALSLLPHALPVCFLLGPVGAYNECLTKFLLPVAIRRQQGIDVKKYAAGIDKAIAVYDAASNCLA